MADELDAPEPEDLTEFELWVTDYSNRQHLVTSNKGPRAEALLATIADLTQYAAMGQRNARDFFVCEVVRVPVDLSHLGKVQQ